MIEHIFYTLSYRKTDLERGSSTCAWVLCSLEQFDTAVGKLVNILMNATAEFYQVTGHLTFAIAIAVRILAHSGKHNLAAELLGLVFTHPNSPQGYLGCYPQMMRLRDNLESQLGPEIYAAAWEAGTRLEPGQAARDLLREFTGDIDVLSSQVNYTLPEPLTTRELDVLALIVDGCTNCEIAEQLYISVNTVKKHINHTFGKLGVKNRVQAIKQAQQMNLLA